MATYLEKIMQAVKVDRALLGDEKATELKNRLIQEITVLDCPGDYFEGAPSPRSDNKNCANGEYISCKDCCKNCWNQEEAK